MLGPIEGGWAGKVLADLLELRQTGLAEPIPFAPKTSAEYARIRFDKRAVAPFKKMLTQEWNRERDETFERFFGAGVTLDGLMAAESVASEERGDLREPSRFGTLARRVFHPLLMVEESCMSGDPMPFDVCGPLPTGTTVLEASAGTGKTYTIAALAARYIAEGRVELDQLMLVTFGRMATNELRLRVRERLVAVEIALGRAIETGTPAAGEGIEHQLTAGPPDELEQRRERVARALADFDAATIATTHEFCLKMLDGLGVLGDREPQAAFVEHLSDLTREVATDLYLRRYAASASVPMSYSEALTVADLAVQAVHARLVPDGPDQNNPAERIGPARGSRAGRVRRGCPRGGRAA